MTRRRTARPTPSIEALLLGLSAFLLATANGRFWTTLLQGRDLAAPATLGVIAAVGAMVLAIHFALPALVSTRRTVRPVATLLIVFAASASFYAQRYGTLIDPSMIRNVLATDTREAGELLSVDLVVHALLYGALPIAAVWWCQPRTRGWRRGLPIRVGAIALALVVGVGALFAVFQDFASTMRNQKSLRYAITPANVVWSLGSVGATAAAGGVAKREPPDPAARVAREGRRPTLLVVVVGETVRAANWPANGYARPTTPELAARTDVTHFTKATACGTSTEVSVPCMFSPHGRADYDESRIRLTDSALHVIARAGVQVLWRDNQAGCKGICSGLREENLSRETVPGLCEDDRCFDEILLHGLDAVVREAKGDLLVVLHQLGNHGPAYFRRYPQAFRRFVPTCDPATSCATAGARRSSTPTTTRSSTRTGSSRARSRSSRASASATTSR